MIKRLLIAIVLLAVLAGGIVGFNMFRDQAIEQFFANMPVPTVTVSTVEAEEARWTPSIEAIGTVNANQGVDLTVETTGIVTDILFEANQQVEKDQTDLIVMGKHGNSPLEELLLGSTTKHVLAEARVDVLSAYR